MPRGLFGLRIPAILRRSYKNLRSTPDRRPGHLPIDELPLYVNPRDLIIVPSVSTPTYARATTACLGYDNSTIPQLESGGSLNHSSLHLPAEASTTTGISASEDQSFQSGPDTATLVGISGSNTQALRPRLNCETCDKAFLRPTELKYVSESNPSPSCCWAAPI